METSFKPNHIGRKIARLRELRNLKQEALALELGISQQAVSKLEQSEVVEDEVLERVAKVLGVSTEGVKNFDEEKIIQNVQNNYDNSVIHGGPAVNFQCTFNPLDKLMEVIEENKNLYERLLKSEQEKVEILKNSIKS